MLSESNPIIRRFIRFLLIPSLYFSIIKEKRCPKTQYQILKDLLYIFFKLKYFPDNYLLCRLWEKERVEWLYYYGSIYDPYQRSRLRKGVLPFKNRKIFKNKDSCYDYCKAINVPLPYQYGCLKAKELKGFIFSILNKESGKKIIVKPFDGKGGKNIFLVSQVNKKIVVHNNNNEIIPLVNFRFSGGRYVVQEYIQQHPLISKISSSINTIRIVTLLSHKRRAIVIGAFMRFGRGNSFIDNTSQGGIKVGIDIKEGSFMALACDKKNNQYKSHPDTDFIFNGVTIPFWKDVMALAIKVQEKLSFNKLMGMDIAISINAPVLIEINDEYDNVGFEQVCGPILANSEVKNEFERYNILINEFQKSL